MKREITLLAIVLFLTVPRVFIGYGVDGDAVRSVRAADQLLQTAHYVPSRFPGNPNFEFMLALINPWAGSVGTNLTVLVFFIVSINLFRAVALDLKLPNGFLLTSIYALSPTLLVNAATTMDYLPGLCLLIGSFLFALRERVALSGILLGVAIGYRITNALFLIPLIVFLFLSGCRRRQIITVTFLTMGLATISFLPIILEYGSRMLSLPPSIYNMSTYIARTVYQSITLFGLIPSATILIIGLVNLKTLRPLKIRPIGHPDVNLSVGLLTIALFVILFITHSDEAEYLIPIVPVIILMSAKLFSRGRLILIGLVILSYGFVDIELKGGKSGKRELEPKLAWGILLGDFRDRLQIQDLRDQVCRLGSPTKTMILTGMGPILTYQNEYLEEVDWKQDLSFLIGSGIDEVGNCQRISGSSVYLLYAISRDNALALRNNGYRLMFFTQQVPSILINKYRYDPYEIGMEPIIIDGDKAFWKHAPAGGM